MKTYQLKFLAWTFSAFLPAEDPDAEQKVDYYVLLDVPTNASADDIKKAYRKQSLQLHPDKLRQRGMRYKGEVISEDEARSRFQEMKHAYDVLSDPQKRQLYDALGHRGMDFVINPSHAYDPHVLIGNLAKSSVFDRSKLMALIVIFFGLVLLQPILICAKVDQTLAQDGGALENSSWVALLVPFWLFAAFYAVLLVIGRAMLPLAQWGFFVLGVLFLSLKFDAAVSWDYAVVFIPFYFWMFLRLVESSKERRRVEESISKMVTIEYIEKYVINEKKQDDEGNDIEEAHLHRTYNDLNEEEKDKINDEYIIVHVPPKTQGPGDDEDEGEDDFDRIERSPEYLEARARHEDSTKSIQRIILPELPLMILIIVQLDMNKNWNWGLTFLPLWLAMFFECCGGCYGFFCTSALAHIEVQEQMADHFAKEQETKEGGEEDNGDEKKKDEKGGEEVKPSDAAKQKSDTAGTADTEKKEKSSPDAKPAGIVTAVSAQPPAKGETTSPETKVDKAESKAEVPEDGDEDDDFMFEMDEDTFHFFQQAEVEAENKATEAQSKAIGSFCNIIFQTLIAALFVAKLNQVYEERDQIEMEGTSSYSTFWILFPFLLISGCIVSCFACAIFGASNIDGALSSEESDENETGGDGDEEAATAAASPVFVPPPPEPVVEAPKDANEPNGQVPSAMESEETPAAPAKAANLDHEDSAMDDLD